VASTSSEISIVTASTMSVNSLSDSAYWSNDTRRAHPETRIRKPPAKHSKTQPAAPTPDLLLSS
jgi:hypothetical protein